MFLWRFIIICNIQHWQRTSRNSVIIPLRKVLTSYESVWISWRGRLSQYLPYLVIVVRKLALIDNAQRSTTISWWNHPRKIVGAKRTIVSTSWQHCQDPVSHVETARVRVEANSRVRMVTVVKSRIFLCVGDSSIEGKVIIRCPGSPANLYCPRTHGTNKYCFEGAYPK